tara:strand:+ start:106 stop:219 length:114 start_codon:yes stop_codon:yes gene_type:complete
VEKTPIVDKKDKEKTKEEKRSTPKKEDKKPFNDPIDW